MTRWIALVVVGGAAVVVVSGCRNLRTLNVAVTFSPTLDLGNVDKHGTVVVPVHKGKQE